MPHFNLMQYLVTLLLNLQDLIDQEMIAENDNLQR